MTRVPDDNVDALVRAYYAGQSARPEWLSVVAGRAAASRPPLWRRPVLGLSTAVAAGIALLLWATVVVPQVQSRRELARSVAALHTAAFTPDLGEVSFADLCRLRGLGFAPVEPERCRKEKYKVLGARVCTIGGAAAAQIRLADEDGDVRTLCEVRDGAFASAGDGHVTVDGVEVSVWREGGLVMGMTGPPP